MAELLPLLLLNLHNILSAIHWHKLLMYLIINTFNSHNHTK